MGTDRLTVFDAEVPGCGRVTIDHCEPDHGWSYRVWYEVRHSLPAEARSHDVVKFPDGFYRVRREDIVARQEVEKAWHAKIRETEEYCKGREYYRLIADHLNTYGSASAAYYHLRDLVPLLGSLSTFRKSFKRGSCTPEWVKRHCRAESVLRLLERLGRKDDRLGQMIVDAERLWARFHEPLRKDGEIICKKGA